MYDPPSHQKDDAHDLSRGAFFIILIVLWLGFIVYAGLIGNVITGALGLPNTMSIKMLVTTLVGGSGTALLLSLRRRPRDKG